MERPVKAYDPTPAGPKTYCFGHESIDCILGAVRYTMRRIGAVESVKITRHEEPEGYDVRIEYMPGKGIDLEAFMTAYMDGYEEALRDNDLIPARTERLG